MFLKNVTRCCSTCSVTITYSYKDTDPPGKLYDECPDVGACGGDFPRSCRDASISGWLSAVLPKACMTETAIAGATLFAGSHCDDYGTIGGIDSTNNCGFPGYWTADYELDVTVEDDTEPCFVRLTVPFTVHNNYELGGPYGMQSVTIRWYIQEP